MTIGNYKKKKFQIINASEVKITVIGEGAVGKTSLIRRWAEGKFEKTYLATLGVDITDKTVHVDNLIFKMILWDIAGQRRYKQFRNAFYKGTQGIIMVADVTNTASLDALPSWKEELEQYVDKELPSILLANKSDLDDDRKVGQKAIHKVGQVIGIPSEFIFETSALLGTNVESAFQSIAALIKKQ